MAHMDTATQINFSFADSYIAKKATEKRNAIMKVKILKVENAPDWRIKIAVRSARTAIKSYYSLFDGMQLHACRMEAALGDYYGLPPKYRR